MTLTRTISAGITFIFLSSILVVGLVSASRVDEMKGSVMPHHAVIAHRGASYWAPEETEPAYILARELGADYLEFDIQLTSDGVPVLFHDDTLERTTNVAEVYPERKANPVTSFSLEELKKLDAGSWFNSRFTDRARPSYKGLKILTLDELIKIASSGRVGQRLYIESKSPERNIGVEKTIVTVLKNTGWLDRSKVVFQSFNLESLKKFQELAPEIPRIYLIDEKMEKESGLDKLFKDAVGIADGIGPVGYIAWPWNIKKAHRFNFQVHVYTINAAWQVRLVNCFGADGIFTDRCDMLLEYYGRGIKDSPSDILNKFDYSFK
jgi:glycerophosphoryl diester phosphodiesterase